MRSRADAIACRACGSQETRFVFSGEMLSRSVDYYECSACRYFQTETPSWLEEAYSKAINDSDTGIMARNLLNARVVLGTLWSLGDLRSRVLDFAGGYGVLVRLLRDYGIDALWTDRYCLNLLASGFDYDGGPVGLVTAFEAFEHFVDPGQELSRMLEIGSSVLLSTELLGEPAPALADWWYYGTEHGQHIGFFRVTTLRSLAGRHGKRLLTDGRTYHLITDRPIDEKKWRMAVRLNRLMPLLVRGKIESRTWKDHALMAARCQR
jgi:hypothetical protein